MSRPSIERLTTWFGGNRDFTVVFDPDGSLSSVHGMRFSAIVSVSVLHHIPDYVHMMRAAVATHLEYGGTLVTLQDPMWYPRQPAFARAIDRMAYFGWRIFQGRYIEGLQTRYRRLRNVYDQSQLADIVEYHVVRQGVDEHALLSALAPSFERCALLPYWSTHSRIWQRIGESLGLHNTFGLVASGFLGLAETSNGADTIEVRT
jgi:hypothetical protein